MKYYPIFLNLKNKRSVIIGGGEVALRKAKDLLEAGAFVKIISPHFHEELQTLNNQNLQRIQREYREGDLHGAALVFSATNDPETNRRVFAEAEARGIFINSVDDLEHCSFIVPSSFARGDLIVAVSTSGASPALAAKIRRNLENAIPENFAQALDAMSSARDMLKNDPQFSSLTSEERGNIIKKISSDDQLIDELIQHHKNGSLAEFLEKIF